MSFFRRLLGKLCVGDRVEVVDGVYKVGFDMGLTGSFQFGVVDSISGYIPNMVYIVPDNGTHARWVNAFNLKRVK